jgi:thiamine-phosphate pyrophosphorylase
LYKAFYKDDSSKPLIYLISPSKIDIKTFPGILSKVLDTQVVNVFQLRLKNYKDSDLISITSLLYKICIKKNVTFILNDRVDIAKKLNVDGVHLGKEDGSIKNARNILGNLKIIGSSCYNNISLSIKSQNLGANYIAFGAFFKTETKENTSKIILSGFKNIRKNINIPIVGIGGLNKFNIKKLIYFKPDFLAFCSSIWNTKRTPQIEIKSIKNVLDNF